MKRFLRRPTKVASVIPSSAALVGQVAGTFDFSQPRVIVEFGPGEGCHTREILRRMHPASRLILFELDDALARHLTEQFSSDARVEVLHRNACDLAEALAERGVAHCDYVLSGIPFSILDRISKSRLLQQTYDCLAVGGKFIIYQVTNELLKHATAFPRADIRHCLLNIPPMFVIVFHKDPEPAAAGSGSHAEELVGIAAGPASETAGARPSPAPQPL